jgi:hypothetical protein
LQHQTAKHNQESAFMKRAHSSPIRNTQPQSTEISPEHARDYIRRVALGKLEVTPDVHREEEFARCVKVLNLGELTLEEAPLSTAIETLKKCPSVHSLTLGDEVDSADFGALAEALETNSTLRTLSIQNCVRFDDGEPLEQLAAGIARNTGLKSLILSYENDDPEQVTAPPGQGLAALGACLAKNSTLNSLSVDFPNMRPEQVNALAAGLAHNRTLTQLTLLGGMDSARLGVMLALDRGALPQLEHLALGGGTPADLPREVAALSRVMSKHENLRTVQFDAKYLEHVETLADGLAPSLTITSLEPHSPVRDWEIPLRIWMTLQRNRGMEAQFGDAALAATCQAFTEQWGRGLAIAPGITAKNQIGRHLGAMLAQGGVVTQTRRQTSTMGRLNCHTAFAREHAAAKELVKLLSARSLVRSTARNS